MGIATRKVRSEGLSDGVDYRQVLHSGQCLGSRAVMDATRGPDCNDMGCAAVGRKACKGRRRRLLVGTVDLQGRSNGRCCRSVHICGERSVLVIVVKRHRHSVCRDITCCYRSDRDGRYFYLRFCRGSERRLVTLFAGLIALEIDLVCMDCRSLPSISEGVILLRVRRTRWKGLFGTVPILNDEVVALTVSKLHLYLDPIIGIAAGIGLDGSRGRAYLRTVWSSERDIRERAVFGFISPNRVGVPLPVSRKARDIERHIGFCRLRTYIGIGNRNRRSSIYTGKERGASLVGVSEVKLERVGCNVAAGSFKRRNGCECRTGWRGVGFLMLTAGGSLEINIVLMRSRCSVPLVGKDIDCRSCVSCSRHMLLISRLPVFENDVMELTIGV